MSVVDGFEAMEIVTASVLDLNSLSRLERACFGKDAWPFLDLIAVLTFADVVRLKAMEAGNMIGFVAGDPRPANGTAWIATIAVLPAFRRKGVGTGLLRACEAALPGERLRLSVRASNEDATRLYEREGYERTEIWQAYYRDGEAAIIMEKLRAK